MIEASAASLLALSRERAVAAASVERDLRAASVEAATFRQRANDHDKIIARLETNVVEQRQDYRDMLDKRARGLEKRVARAEEGMGAMASEIGIRVTEATRRLRWLGVVLTGGCCIFRWMLISKFTCSLAVLIML